MNFGNIKIVSEDKKDVEKTLKDFYHKKEDEILPDYMNKKVFSEYCGCTYNAICKACVRGDIVTSEDPVHVGLIDAANPKNNAFRQRSIARARKIEKKNSPKEKYKHEIKERDKRREENDNKDQDLLSQLERANIENTIARARLAEAKTRRYYDKLIDKEIVENVFAQIENVFRSQVLSIGPRCAPLIASILSINDSEKKLEMQAIIDKETYRAIESVKKITKKKLKNEDNNE